MGDKKVIQVESDATYKTHTFEILKEGTYNGSKDYFYLVKDQKAKKYKYQIISLSHYIRVFHSSGRVETQEEAEKWFNEYSKKNA